MKALTKIVLVGAAVVFVGAGLFLGIRGLGGDSNPPTAATVLLSEQAQVVYDDSHQVVKLADAVANRWSKKFTGSEQAAFCSEIRTLIDQAILARDHASRMGGLAESLEKEVSATNQAKEKIKALRELGLLK